MIDTEAVERAEQIKSELRKLVGCRIIEILADSNGHEDYFGLRAESPKGDVVECWLTELAEAKTLTIDSQA